MNQANIPNLDNEHFKVVVFGSARVKESEQLYKDVYQIGYEVGKMGADIVTGGGPGLMEAANKGHFDATPDPENKTRSIGIRIQLPFEESSNENLDCQVDFEKFSGRLDAFINVSDVVVVAPGGVGTLLELAFVWQLVQVGHVKKIPIIIMGEQWANFKKWANDNIIENAYADSDDLECLIEVASSSEVIDKVKELYKSHKK